MRALVISGGGSKGAFAGGVAQYLLQENGNKYDILIGSSTGSLLIPHLALGKVEKIYNIYSNVDMRRIFNLSPFIVKNKNTDKEIVTINHLNVIKQFFNKKRTFGESTNLLDYIKESFTVEEFKALQQAACDVIVTVTNFSKNEVEYKSIDDFEYDDFCEWIWISCNYVPFMSLATKNGFDYGDGGFSSLVPIREAILRGAKEIDVIILETEVQVKPKSISRNPFTLMIDLFQILLTQVEKQNITIGKLAAKNKSVKLNLYYTPTQLTDNALIFNKEKMKAWWQQGYDYAKNKSEIMSDNVQ
ncbi:MAG TPA: patatin-like phospholipase family protein [Flavobacterium sp.]|jgi:predicted patatin/cPLA2 family phospholipase|uniref:patatin-like phospholipase family protein n=1 Tax=Flavobacterium sp. TaxID=239 RepID=UPI002C8D568E|nr:patatin-like phospholipase family protein [Flavobacterium sp.]MCA0350282.1 patatin-like phospholipase family protein [Bacteroidota bacterium]HPW98744.1 patatin-like phospholipase family protein [Flavobacterium sp.]HQA75132.1 patatin-like phospholipase family protein [Flavobacterium sp.]